MNGKRSPSPPAPTRGCTRPSPRPPTPPGRPLHRPAADDQGLERDRQRHQAAAAPRGHPQAPHRVHAGGPLGRARPHRPARAARTCGAAGAAGEGGRRAAGQVRGGCGLCREQVLLRPELQRGRLDSAQPDRRARARGRPRLARRVPVCARVQQDGRRVHGVWRRRLQLLPDERGACWAGGGGPGGGAGAGPGGGAGASPGGGAGAGPGGGAGAGSHRSSWLGERVWGSAAPCQEAPGSRASAAAPAGHRRLAPLLRPHASRLGAPVRYPHTLNPAPTPCP
jgi:hypothetical protein